MLNTAGIMLMKTHSIQKKIHSQLLLDLAGWIRCLPPVRALQYTLVGWRSRSTPTCSLIVSIGIVESNKVRVVLFKFLDPRLKSSDVLFQDTGR